jgi:hypothetical protein
MSFPATKLPLITEMLIDGVWTDVTSGDANGRMIDDGRKLVITRGRRDWASRVVASHCQSVFFNLNGFYSDRLPTSPNYLKLGRTVEIRHRIRWVRATFTGGTSSSWPVADTGQVWTNTGGVAADYNGTGTKGTHTHPNVSIDHVSSLTLPVQVTDVTVRVNVGQVSTGDHVYGGVALGVDNNNCYNARLIFRTDSNVQLQVIKRVAGVQTTLFAATTIGTYVVGTQYDIRLQIRPGGFIRAAAWLSSTNPTSTTWNTALADTELTSFPAGILRSVRGAANTNANAVVAFDEFEVNDYRFWAEGAASAPTSDLSGRKVLAPFESVGILQRLTAGDQPRLSAPRRYLEGLTGTVPVASWTLEDGQLQSEAVPTWGAQTLQPFVGTHPSGAVVSYPRLGTGTLAPWLPSVVSRSSDGGLTSIWGRVSMPAFAGTWTVDLAYASGTADQINGVDVNPSYLPDGALGWPQLIFDPKFQTIGVDHASSSMSAVIPRLFDGLVHHVRWIMTQVGGDVSQQVFVDGAFISSSSGATATLAPISTIALYSAPGTASVAIGYLSAWTTPAPIADYVNAVFGYRDETAAARLARVCGSENIPFQLMDVADQTTPVGPQPTATIPDILFRAADADQGILYEPRDALALAYRPRATMYDQTGPTLNYDGGHIAEPFLPTEDDQTLLNDVTARRDNGGFARVVITDGRLGTDAINPRPEDLTWNVASDSELAGIAGWRAHLGTVDEARFPMLTVNMAAPDVAGDVALMGQLASLDLGDLVTVENLPAWLPPDDVRQLIQGCEETFGDGKEWSIAWNCTPGGAWSVYEYAADASDTNPDVGRYGPDSLQLASSVTSTATSWSVNCTPAFTTGTAAEFSPPIRAMLGGEEVWITNATGAGPFTLTVQRSKNGVVKAHDPSDSRELDITLLDNAIYVP